MDNTHRTRWSRLPALCLSVSVMTFLFLAPAVAAGSVTRGSIFTVSIADKPATAYYVWFTGTSSMSGKPGDQPPVIIANTENVEFDPDGGPYTIGSYQFYNGGGRTILDDVAPSSDTVSNTRYYAKVTTDSDGFGIIQFQTSSATADRTFTIKAENPASPGDNVPVRLGLPTRKTTATIAATPFPTTIPSLPPTTVPVPATTVIVQHPTTEATPQPPAAPKTSPVTPVPTGIVILAAAAGFLLMRKRV